MGFGLTFPARVVRVLDGDTIEVEVKRTIRIRLLDCWAPETRTRDLDEKEQGMKSKHALVRLLAFSDGAFRDVKVEVPIEKQDKFGDAMSMSRVLAFVECDGEDVSSIMVRDGHATTTKQKKGS